MEKKTSAPLAIVFMIVGVVLTFCPKIYNLMLASIPKLQASLVKIFPKIDCNKLIPRFALVSWMGLAVGIILILLGICGLVASVDEKKRYISAES